MIGRARVLQLGAFLLAILGPMSAANAADIGLSPARLSLQVAPGGTVTGETTVFSTSSKPVTLMVSMGDWTQASDGKLTFLPPGTADYSATPWATPSATSLVVPPNGKATLRISFQVPNDASLAGTYQSVVFVETQATPSAGKGTQFLTKQRLGLVAYVTIAGTATHGSKLSDMYLDGHDLKVVLDNTGNTLMRASGKVELRDSAGKTVATIPVSDVPVMRGSERDLALALPKDLAPGYYVALALINDPRGGSLVGQLPFTLGN